jgi:hypothetical protein
MKRISILGIRGHHNPALFRVSQVDSDDDQSGGSRSVSPHRHSSTDYNQLVNIIPTPVNGSCKDIRNTSNPTENNRRTEDSDDSNNTENRINTIQMDLQKWDQSKNNYSPKLAMYWNALNESEIESCCSTRSTADDTFSPSERNVPSTSSGIKEDNRNVKNPSSWLSVRQKQKIKRMRRNYRNHSNGPTSNGHR